MIDADVLLPANVVARIELPEIEDEDEVALSPEEVVSLADAMREIEPRLEITVWLAACAGLRKGEVSGLKRSAVDWEAGLLYIREQRQRGRAAKLKTKASYARCPSTAS
ncbi:hypothetical protein ABT373_09815 [Streptomyces sp. NPDC000070]|uniref:hypothetical protein n=1 Tax=Streptomyces sp. NPDC000070 TaxID=3154240 RepID=UPI003329965B